jgi:Lrp/AsnC family leucine-responsive transcriptional regulator
MIDDIDRKILNILQEDARTSNAEVARRVGMAPSAVFERIKKLEERGVIAGYSARIDPHAVGLGLLAFVFVRSTEGVDASNTERRLVEIPEVLEVHHVAGEDCFLVKIRAPDTESLGGLLRERFGAIKTIQSTRTTIVLQTIKETTELPYIVRNDEVSKDGGT